MNAPTPVISKQYRLAEHYLGKLRGASRAYRSGDENTAYGLKLAGQDWPQIQHWQAWTAARADQQREAALLCSAYPFEGGELLGLLLTPEEHRAWRESALAAARREEDPRAELAHLLALGEICLNLNIYEQSDDYIKRALLLAQSSDDQRAVGQALWITGRLAMSYRGSVVEGRHCFEESLANSRRFQDQVGIARSLIRLAMLADDAGSTTQADQYAAEALHIFRQLGNSRGMAEALNTLGTIHVLSDNRAELEAGLEHLRESLRLYKALGDQAGGASVYGSLVLGLHHTGDVEGMLTAGEEGLELYRRLGSQGGVGVLLLNMGSCLFEEGGDLEQAYRYCSESLQIGRQIGSPSLTAYSLWCVGFLAALEGDFTTGLAYAEDCVALHRKLGEVVRVFLGLNLIVFASIGLGQLEQARHAWLEAFPMIAQLDSQLWIAAGAAWLCLRLDKQAQSLTLIRLVETHSGRRRWLNDQLLRFARQELEAALGAQALAQALEPGDPLEIEATLAAIFAELDNKHV